MSFDAPVVLALAPLLGGAVWFGAAWARRARVRRAALWSQETVRAALAVFAGSSYVLSPLSVDGSALGLSLDALDPGVASEGGTGLAGALRQGGELVGAGSELADRVVVVFTDGEAHDTVPDIVAQAERLRALGVHLILVAEGTRTPTRIPVR